MWGLFALRPSGLRRQQTFFVFAKKLFPKKSEGLSSVIRGVFLIFLSIYTAINSQKDTKFWKNFNGFVLDVSSPILLFPTSITNVFASFSLHFQTNKSLRKEVRELTRQLHLLKQKNYELQVFQHENEHLKNILNVPPSLSSFQTIQVKVLGIPSDHLRSSMIVAGAKRNGIYKNLAAICADGVIGRVSEVGASAARIMLINDVNSKIPVRIQSTGEQAILTGQNSDTLILTHIDNSSLANSSNYKNNRAKVGDIILTSGFGGIYPPDLPVAIITNITGDQIQAHSIAKTTSLRYVSIIKTPFMVEADE